MTLKLKNFKKTIDPTLLGRGREYFKNQQVTDLEEIGDGAWAATVQGSEVYSVEISQLEDEALAWECDCPYDMGPVCKHVAAVLYAIEDNFSEYFEKKPRKPAKKRKTQAEELTEILTSLSKETLIELLQKQVKENRQFAATILARYGTGDDKKAFLKLIKAALNAEKDRGFLDYHASNRAARKIFPLLEEAHEHVEAGRIQKAIPIFQAMIETVTPVIEHADDSNGELADCINLSVLGLESLTGKLQDKERIELFNYCLKESIQKVYRGWDWCWDLARIAANLVQTSTERQALADILETISHSSNSYGDGWYSDYRKESAANIMLSVIERLDSPEDAETYIKANLEMESMRERLIMHYIQQEKFTEAKQLVQDFLTSEKSKQYRGLESRFLDLLLQINQKEGNNAETIRLAQSQFESSGNFHYYEILKKTVEQDEWATTVKKILKSVRPSYYGADVYAEIYRREEMWTEFINYIRAANRHTIEAYRDLLESRYPQETSGFYEKFALEIISQKVNRKGYQEACIYLRRMQKLGDKARVEVIVSDLKEKYSNRLALLDELKKL